MRAIRWRWVSPSSALTSRTKAAFPSRHLRQHDLHSGASVLVSGRESPVGVVAVYTACPRAFSDEDISFLQAAANVLGLAIDRKRLESQLRQRVAELADTDRRKDEFLAMLRMGCAIPWPPSPIPCACSV